MLTPPSATFTTTWWYHSWGDHWNVQCGNRVLERSLLIPHPCREGDVTDGSFSSTQQGYLEDYDQHRGKGSFPAMITPAYQNAKKAHQLASDVSTTLGPPADPQKQRRSETEAVLTETYTRRTHLLEPSQNRLLAFNFYPDFCIHCFCGPLYLLQRRWIWTNGIPHFRSAEVSATAGPGRYAGARTLFAK